MPLVIDATVGGATSNCYVSLADAETYMLGRVNPWTGTDVQKTAALVNATTVLEQESWAGTKGNDPASALVQALAWPRRWVPTLEFTAYPEYVTDNFIDTSVAFYSSLTIPAPLVQATCELAMELLRAGTTDRLSFDRSRNVKMKKVDVLETEYFDPWQRARGLGLFPSVLAKIAHLLRSADCAEVSRV